MVEDMGDFGTGVTPPPPPGEAPQQPRSRSKARGAAAGVGVALVVGAGGIAVATSGSPSTTASPGATPTTEGAPSPGAPTPAPGVRGPGHGFPGGGRMGGPGGGLLGIGAGGPVLHGTYVVSKTGGGYETKQVQTGTVTSVSSTSIAVSSKDGFTFSYVVKAGTSVDAQRDGITSVKKGDEVVVTATLSGKTGTVDRVVDTTELKATAPKVGAGERPGFGGRRGAPSTASPTPGTGT